MRLLVFLLCLTSLKAQASSSFYVSPLGVGIMNALRSSGEPGVDSIVTTGGEVFLQKGQLLLGLKYDHIENSWEGNAALAVRNKKDILFIQAGYRVLTGVVSPYVFTGGGAFFQTAHTRIQNVEETNYSTMFGYKLGLGVLAEFSESWGANLSMHFYPQSFINSFNYILSLGFIL